MMALLTGLAGLLVGLIVGYLTGRRNAIVGLIDRQLTRGFDVLAEALRGRRERSAKGSREGRRPVVRQPSPGA